MSLANKYPCIIVLWLHQIQNVYTSVGVFNFCSFFTFINGSSGHSYHQKYVSKPQLQKKSFSLKVMNTFWLRAPSPYPGKKLLFLRKDPYQSPLPWFYRGWITMTAVCGDYRIRKCAVFNLCKIRHQGLWHWQRRESTPSLSRKTSTDCLWRIVLIARFFHMPALR